MKVKGKTKSVRIEGGGKEFKMHVDVRQDNTPVAMMAQFVRGLDPKQRRFFKDCRVVSFIPMYLPEGAFSPDMHALKLDPDQLDWAVKNFPEFKAVDDTKNNFLSTGRPIQVSVN